MTYKMFVKEFVTAEALENFLNEQTQNPFNPQDGEYYVHQYGVRGNKYYAIGELY